MKIPSLKSSIHHTLITALLLLGIGCATPPAIESRKEPGRTDVIARLFVVSNLAAVKEEMAATAEIHLTAQLRAAGIPYKYVTVSPLNTTQDQLQLFEDVSQYRPDGLLVIKAAGGVRNPGGTILSINVDAVMYDKSQNVIIWHGMMKNVSPEMKTMAVTLVQRLQEDGLLVAKPH